MVSIEMVQHLSAFKCHLSDTVRYFSDSNSENWLVSHIVWGAIFFSGRRKYAEGKPSMLWERGIIPEYEGQFRN